MAYLDHCATTPLDARVRGEMDRVLDLIQSGKCANPSSVHAAGRAGRALLNDARRRVAELLGTKATEIVFTASGSEANNLAIKGLAMRSLPRPFHLIISAIEHDSVRHTARYLAAQFDWVQLKEIEPDSSGIVQPESLDAACREGVSLVSVMSVNNETGVCQPIKELAGVAHRHGGLFHTDAVQAMGRLAVHPAETGCDLLSLAGHKIYGPRGAGVIYIREGIRIDSIIHGGPQELAHRAGTENLEAIVGMARAVELADTRRDEDRLKMLELEEILLANMTDISFIINGSANDRLPGILNLSVEGLESHDLVVGMDLAGYAISAGSACSSGVIEPSHVLQAMDLEPWRIRSGVRISFGRHNTADEAASAGRAFSDLCGRLREASETDPGQV